VAEQHFEDTKNQAVLVRTNSLKELRRAYPNYFADTRYFTSVLQKLPRADEVEAELVAAAQLAFGDPATLIADRGAETWQFQHSSGCLKARSPHSAHARRRRIESVSKL
jgi:hypothetical protein